MGIKGLHAAIKHLKTQKHVSELGLTRVAVDASSFMVKGGIRYAREFFRNTLDTKPWAEYCLDIALTLQMNGIVPIFVFDGQRLPLKDATSKLRHAIRDNAYHEAQKLEEQGNIEQATKKWQQAFEVDDAMVDDVIGMLFMNNIEWNISAWESDQTMAAMYKEGLVDGVVTEDSDMVAYGVDRIVFKLHMDGYCEYLDTTSDTCPDDPPPTKRRRIDVSIASLSKEQLAQMCTLAGNDYNPNIQGIGIKKVYSMITQHSWDTLLSVLSASKEYIETISKTLHVFMHPEDYTTKNSEKTCAAPCETML